MMKDLFPLKLLFSPSEAFAGFASGRTGWGWPLLLCALSALASSALLAWAPRDFLAGTAAGLPPPDGSFLYYSAVSLAGEAALTLFSGALLAGFAGLLAGGRLMLRVPLPPLLVAGYAFFFLAARSEPALKGAGWPVFLAALAAAAWAARRAGARYAALLKLFLSVSVFSLLAAALGAVTAPFGLSSLQKAGEYTLAFLSLFWLGKGLCAVTGLSAARAAAALVPALLGALAFAFSLMALGLISPAAFQLLMML